MDKPVISIGNDIEDFFYVGIDNYKAMREMIQHLYKVHDCRKFWFIMGPADHYENQQRTKALKDYMKEMELDCDADVFYFESYEYRCGTQGFIELLEKHNGDIPDAVICANDNIAVGVCESAKAMGYKIPKDFSVTGFDDYDKASYFTPRITTVSHIGEDVGCACVDLLIKLWKGQEVEKFYFTKTECVLGKSCGCKPDKKLDLWKHIKNRIMYELETEEFEEQVHIIEHELLSCKSVSEMAKLIQKCIPVMHCEALYLVLDEHLNDFKHQTDYYS